MLVALVFAAGFAVQSPSQPALTLAQAVAQARAASPLRGAAQELALGSASAAALAGRLFNPLVDVRVENFGTAARSTLPLDVFAVVSQPFEIAGKRGLRIGLAAADRDVAGANLRLVEWQLALQTVQLYTRALKARGLVDALTANRGDLATIIDTMRRRVEEGRAAEADLLKFETESARMDTDIARAELELARSLSVLSFVIGASAPVSREQLVEPDPVAPPRVSDADLVAALMRHPEVSSAASRVTRARQVRAWEHARRIPDPIVTAGYKRTNGLDTGVAGVTLAVPLFDRNGLAVARAVGEERAAAAEQDAVVLRLAAEARALVAAAQGLTERSARASQELLAPADIVRNATRAAFNEGTADVLRLIDAERVYRDVRRAALELRLDALTTSLEARFAMGEEVFP